LVLKLANIAVIGAGYVGMSIATLLAKSGHYINIIDIDPVKIKKINEGKSSVDESEINEILNNNELDLSIEATELSQAIYLKTKIFL